MASTGTLLWKAVRKPMWRWYRRTGVWWLVAMAAAFSIYLVQEALPWPPVTRLAYWVRFLWVPGGLIVLGAWLHAAEVMDELAIGFFDKAAGAVPLDSLRWRFWLAYLQGAIPLLCVFLFACAMGISYHPRVGSWNPFDALAWLELCSGALMRVLYTAWPMIWCVVILVLLPSRRVLAWLLALSWAATSVVGAVIRDLVPPPSGGDVEWYRAPLAIGILGYIVSAVILLAMLHAYRRGMPRVAAWPYWLILASLLAGQVLYRICSYGLDGAAVTAAYAALWMTRCFTSCPRFFSSWADHIATTFPTGKSLLHYAGYTLQGLWPYFWLAVALCAVHYWILAPARMKPSLVSDS